MPDLLSWKPTKSGKPRKPPKPKRPPPALEFATCCTLADLLRRFAKPDWRWSHFPAGEHRTEATAARLQRMGLKPGWPDYLFLGPDGITRYLEMKRRGSGRLTDEQEDFRRVAEPHGIWAMARSIDEAATILAQWGVLRDGVKIQ